MRQCDLKTLRTEETIIIHLLYRRSDKRILMAPSALWIYRSRGGQQLQGRSQNCYWGETPTEPEPDSWFDVEHSSLLPPVHMATFCSFHQKTVFCHSTGYPWHNICALGPVSESNRFQPDLVSTNWGLCPLFPQVHECIDLNLSSRAALPPYTQSHQTEQEHWSWECWTQGRKYYKL